MTKTPARRKPLLRGLAASIALAAALASVAGARPGGAPTNESRYLTMRDGVRIAVDVWLPSARSGKIPALIYATRYWRAAGFKDPNHPDSSLPEAKNVTGAGYAVVNVDVRGTGASFGTWPSPWSRAEVADLGQVVDWIVRQPWSNGRVGAYGISYSGSAAEFVGTVGRPAVKAVVPQFSDPDPYGLNLPGGILTDWYIKDWQTSNQALDRNDICAALQLSGAKCREFKQVATGVKPVDGDVGGRLVRAAVKQHAANVDVYAAARKVEFRDDPFGTTPFAVWSPYTYFPRLARAGVAVQAWVGWYDGATVASALGRFAAARNPQTLLIGPWNHGGGYDTDPFAPPNKPVSPSPAEQFRMKVAFLDPYLKGTARPAPKRQIRYYTMGEEAWHSTAVWPPRGLTTQHWFFAADGELARERPTAGGGADRYAVDFEATTGSRTRWHTQAGDRDVVYPDRAREDRKLLTYTSTPLRRDLEITGQPVVTLHVTSTATDGAFFAYLEDVAPNGRVTYITEGQLRALHRKVSNGKPPYPVFGPYHSFLRADAKPLVPGEHAELRFALQPTSVLIRKGHRIRIAIAGHDKGSFTRIPRTGKPVITIARNSVHASGVDLPVRATNAAAPPRSSQELALRRSLDRLVATGVPGAIALVRDGNRTIRVTSGYGDLATKTPLRATDRIRVGSITKTFVATVVLQLVGERKLSLDDSVEQLLPGVVPNGGNITIRQLLNMTSGLYNYLDDPRVFRPYLAGNFGYVWSPKRLVSIALSHGPTFAPGTSWEYSNTNYVLLGLIVEKVTGHSLGAELGRRIFAPLHLRATSFDTQQRIAGRHSHGYYPNGKQLLDTSLISPSHGWAAGAIVSTADDVATFFRALSRGQLLRAQLLREMRTTISGYGLGLGRLPLPCGTTWGHGGKFVGYVTDAWSSTDGGRQVVLFANLNSDSMSKRTKRAWDGLLGIGYCGSALHHR